MRSLSVAAPKLRSRSLTSTKSRSLRPHQFGAFKRSTIALLLPLLFTPPGHNIAFGNPVGEKVISGNASFQRSGNALIVNQSSDRAIINWQGFSIGTAELTKFIQPGASSAVLNRVVSGNPSSLLGQLESNGRVFLINPNGILV